MQDAKCFFLNFYMSFQYTIVGDASLDSPMQADDMLFMQKNNEKPQKVIMLPKASQLNAHIFLSANALLAEHGIDRSKNSDTPVYIYLFKTGHHLVAESATGEAMQQRCITINQNMQHAEETLKTLSKRAKLDAGITEQHTVAYSHANVFSLEMTPLNAKEIKNFFQPLLAIKPTSIRASRNPYRIITAMVANALVIAMSGGMLVVFILSLGPVATLGFGIIGSIASCFVLFSWLMSAATGYKQREKNTHGNQKRESWGISGDIIFIASILFKSAAAAVLLAAALGALGVMSCGTLGTLLMLVSAIVSMVGAMGMDGKMKLRQETVEENERLFSRTRE
jgi:hypothetical protein